MKTSAFNGVAQGVFCLLAGLSGMAQAQAVWSGAYGGVGVGAGRAKSSALAAYGNDGQTPVLGWAAMTGEVGPEALILFLIIFLWTPPHFWALALYRVEDYRKSGLPMLPVTHGNEFTRLQVLLYTFVLFAACLLPFVYGMNSWIYLFAAVVLSLIFCWYGFRLWRNYSDELARQTFRFSLTHLSLLFAAMLVDHYVLQ